MPDTVGFEASYKRHLAQEQRRAVLRAIASDLEPETTMGEILDAAEGLGWGNGLGELSLHQLAEVLLAGEQGKQMPAANEETHTHASARTRRRGHRGNASQQGTGELDAERMDLDRASDVFVPMVEDLGQATMKDLEDRTGIGRRKLRFHIGQLVKSGQLTRHGMGRSTYYTAS